MRILQVTLIGDANRLLMCVTGMYSYCEHRASSPSLLSAVTRVTVDVFFRPWTTDCLPLTLIVAVRGFPLCGRSPMLRSLALYLSGVV